MLSLLRRPQALLLLFLAGFALVLGALWLPQGAGPGELFLPLAKSADFLAGCASVHGIAWWTPSYLGGHSLATTASTAVDFILLEAGRFVLSPLAGDIGAYKIVGLLALVAAGWAMGRFVAAASGSAAAGAWAGIFYAACPEFSLRLARAEHLVTALAFPFVPLVLHRLWRLRREGEARRTANVLAAALLLSALLLTWSKVGFLALPLVAAFGAWLAWEEPGDRRAFLLDCGRVVALVGALVGFLLLPLLREERWMNLFAFDPMDGWQHAFALKTAFSWWDRHGALLAGTPIDIANSGSAFYLGFVWSAALAAALAGAGPLRGWMEGTAPGRLCRLFATLALGFAWLSYGPASVWQAHRAALAQAAELPNWSIALLWLALALQAAAVGALAARWSAPRFRRWLPWAAIAFFVFVPGFRLFELIPLYGALRAPASIWTIDGSACLAVAGALALADLLRRVLAGRWLAVGAAAALLFLLADFSAYYAEFGRKGLPEGTYAGFQEAAEFMRDDPQPGGVFAFSGGYYYLQIPQLAGRALVNEAATTYFQLRWTRALFEAAKHDEGGLDRFFVASGAAFLLLDKSDPAVAPEMATALRARYPVAFENASFAVLRDANAVAPGLAAANVGVARDDTPRGPMLQGVFTDAWTLTPGLDMAPGPVPAPAKVESDRIHLLQPREADYQTIRVASVPADLTWVIVPESYHPDWTAEADGQPLPVYRALGCYLAAPLPHPGAEVTFRFQPPAWYSASWALGFLSWIAVGGLALRETLRRRTGTKAKARA